MCLFWNCRTGLLLKSFLKHKPKSNHSVWIKTKTVIKTNFISHNISTLNLSLNELKLVAKSRSIKGYKSMSKEKLLSALSESESVGSTTSLSKNSFDDER